MWTELSRLGSGHSLLCGRKVADLPSCDLLKAWGCDVQGRSSYEEKVASMGKGIAWWTAKESWAWMEGKSKAGNAASSGDVRIIQDLHEREEGEDFVHAVAMFQGQLQMLRINRHDRREWKCSRTRSTLMGTTGT